MAIKPKSIPTMIRENLGYCMCSEALFKLNKVTVWEREVFFPLVLENLLARYKKLVG